MKKSYLRVCIENFLRSSALFVAFNSRQKLIRVTDLLRDFELRCLQSFKSAPVPKKATTLERDSPPWCRVKVRTPIGCLAYFVFGRGFGIHR